MADVTNDSYTDVALIFACFLCQRCSAELLRDPDWRPDDPDDDEWAAFGRLAREAGWRVEWVPGRDDWLVHCPACARAKRVWCPPYGT
jgi:hypothetical protein